MPRGILTDMALSSKNIKNIFIYAMPLFAGYGLTILTLPILTRLMTPHDFGIVALAWAFPTISVGIFTCGLASSVQRYYFEFKTDEQKLSDLVFSSQVFLYSMLIASALGVYLAKDQLSRITMMSPEYGTAVFVAYLSAYFGQMINYYLTLYQSMERASVYSSFSIIQAVITSLGTLVFVWRFKMSYMGMLYGSLIGNALVCIGMLFHFNKNTKVNFDGKSLFEAIRYGLQVVSKTFTGFVNKFFDKYMLNNMLSLSVVGVYNIGQTVGNAIFMLMNTVWSSFQPVCYQEIFDKGTGASASTGRLFTIFSYIALLPLLLLILFAQEIVTLIAPAPYYEAIDLIIVISGGIATQVFGMYAGVQYAYTRKAYWLFPITAIGTLANVAANILLIPKYGLMGAGLATVFSMLTTNVIFLYVGQTLFKIEYEWRTLIGMLSIVFLSVASILYMRATRLSLAPLYGTKLSILTLYVIIGVKAKIITRQSLQMVPDSLFRQGKRGEER